MIYTSSAMQLLYVRMSFWHMETLSEKNIALNLDDVKTLKSISLWYFVGCSVYMLLPINKIYLAIKARK